MHKRGPNSIIVAQQSHSAAKISIPHYSAGKRKPPTASSTAWLSHLTCSKMQQFLERLWDLLKACLAFLQSLRGKNHIYFESTKMSVVLDTSAASLSGDGGSSGGGGTLGEGAFATVYRARDKFDPSKYYAVKKMFLQSPEFERSLYQEVDSFQRFKHANILRLIDSQVTAADASNGGQKVAYLLFPLMRRGTLRDELNRTIFKPTAQNPLGSRMGLRGPRALAKILSDFLGVVSAFNVLHTHSPAYVHQDIKPENILIADDGTPLLTDFGSVRLADISITNRAQSLAVADEAASFCTISYRAPELFDPPKGTKLDTRTDVWGMGCLLFAWWYGHSPVECEFSESESGSFKVRVVECSHSRVLARIPRPPPKMATPEDTVVQEICEWVLERNPAVRVFTADVMMRLRDALVEVDDKV